MLDHFHILTITHNSTSLSEIGSFMVAKNGGEEFQSKLKELKVLMNLNEFYYLATCNRVLYFFTCSADVTPDFVQRFFNIVNPALTEEKFQEVQNNVFHHQGIDAFNHLFEVSSSINSLVVGEREILRQLREAYDQCTEFGLTGDDIRMAMNAAVAAAKEVYSKTRIGEKSVSVVSLAVDKLLKANLPKDIRILMIGAGQTNDLVSKFLTKYQYDNVVVFNRTLSKAEKLAQRMGGQALPMSELENYREGFDCLIVCTGSTKPIITQDLYKNLLQGDTSEKLVIDLSIPHNVAADVTLNNPISYIEVEGLRNVAKQNLSFREQEVQHAKERLLIRLEEFPAIYQQRQLERALSRVPVEIKAVKSRALDLVFRKEVEELDGETKDLLVRMLTYMEKKCIGIPMKAAREALL